MDMASSAAPIWTQIFLFGTVAAAICQGSARKFSTSVMLLAVQSLAMTGAVLVLASAGGQHHLVMSAIISGVLKGVFVPFLLTHMLHAAGASGDNRSVLGPGQALVITTGLTLLAYYIAPGLLPGANYWQNIALPAALALLLIGGYLLITRRSALSQVVGLLVIENGISLAALATAWGMPLPVELGVLGACLAGAYVMALLVREMHGDLHTTDTTLLSGLKG